MLRELLRILEGGEGYTHAELALRLDVSEGLVSQMLDDLKRMGRLRLADGPSGGACASCPFKGMCFSRTCAFTANGRRTWIPMEVVGGRLS